MTVSEKIADMMREAHVDHPEQLTVRDFCIRLAAVRDARERRQADETWMRIAVRIGGKP